MNKTKIYIVTIIFIFLSLLIIYIVGPKVRKPTLDKSFHQTSLTINELNDSINEAESSNPFIKPDNQSRIIFAHQNKEKTPYSLLYLHGFTASYREGYPINEEFAKKYSMNLYMPRLYAHGLSSEEPLFHLDADSLWTSAKNALAVAEKLGDKVIIMSCSTGGTLALFLAANYHEKIAGLINFSPNIEPNEPGIFFVDKPWGLQIAQFACGSKCREIPKDACLEYWSEGYRLEAVTALMALVNNTMTKETFSKIKTPTLNLAYYKNENEQDPIVKVSKIKQMNDALATPDSLKVYKELPNVGTHVMATDIYSKDLNSVREAVYNFAENTLKLKSE